MLIAPTNRKLASPAPGHREIPFHTSGKSPLKFSLWLLTLRLPCVCSSTTSPATWAAEDLKYVGRIFHDFRRTAARNMIAAGTPQVVAMRITCHRTDAMFRRYAIVNEDQKRQALANTQQYVAASTSKKVVRFKG
jgi:hypothetical protein